MAKKRKLENKSSEPTETPQRQRRRRQQQSQAQPQQEEKQNTYIEEEEEEEEEFEDYGVEEAEAEEYEEGEGEEYEEEEYEEEEGEEEEDDEEEEKEVANTNNPTFLVSSSSASDAANRDDGDADEPIQKVLEPLSKDQLVNLLREAAEKHADVADRVRKAADEDPVHRKIFVHGLSWDTTAEILISAFRQYGEIEDCRAVCDKISGKSKGYGFILFKTRKGAREALKQPQKKIGSRMTACQLASIGPVLATAAAPVVQAQPVSEFTQRKIYVSNVSSDLDPQKLLTFFSKYGEIEEGPLGLDRQTGRPKGFCLFVYKMIESAKKALEEPHKNFEGHVLHCQKAIDGPKPGKSQHPQHNNAQKNPPFQRIENPNFIGSATTGPVAGPGHLMAPSAPGIGLNPAAAQALNPAALGQALTALLATQGTGLGLPHLLSTLGSAGVGQGVPGAGHGMQVGYGNHGAGSSIGGYVSQGVGGYPNQQMGQGGSSRSQHDVGYMSGVAQYMGQ
ncbi:UBP1-associated protein 2A [Malania oleifera]|uniref:UBP1-associated protein 2A n=1 Tax=Malania oleifera TaxID=397392 RepID=UPI0025AE030D|nr:UBP1-associated protein 2A [Malania oleifera]